MTDQTLSERPRRHSFLQVLRREGAERFYEWFEQVVVIALSLIIAAIIVIALLELYRRTLPLVLGGAFDPLDHGALQNLFGSIFTVIIAMEFKHSILRASLRRDSVVQARTVMLIALLAISRKFVVLDIASTSALTIAALAGSVLSLGVAYVFLREDPTPDQMRDA